MTQTALSLHDVAIGYGSHTVASHINATIAPGELTCLIGRNGVGKSTLLRTISAFQPPLHGTITIGGRSIGDYSPRELAQTLGVVLTERPDMQLTTVRQLVALGRQPYTGFWGRLSAEDEGCVEQAMRQVGIEPLADRQVATLSDGERQKAMIAKALAQQTSIICLDEPTAFLDYTSKAETLLLLRRLARGQQKTIFLSTHDIELTLQVADRLWVMQRGDEGATVAIGSPRELAADGTLATFIEQGEGVSFCPATMTISINSHKEQQP